jgi:hypothetical protein
MAAVTPATPRDGILTALLEGSGVVGFKGAEGSIEHFPARHNHDIQSTLRLESWSDFVAPEQLPRQALRAISTDGRTQFAACGDTQPRVCVRVRNDDDGHEPRVKPGSLRIGAFEFRAAANAFAWR